MQVNKTGLKLILGFLFMLPSQYCLGSIFNIMNLPRGKNVTINRPATTKIALNHKVKLTATDSPQTVSFKVLTPKTATVTVAVYDKKNHKIRDVAVKASQTSLYSFSSENNTIYVIPRQSPSSNKPNMNTFIQIESDRPLNIAH